jgi:hypothetical protein
MPCARCAELEAELAHLNDQLGERDDLARLVQLRQHLKVMPATARVILRLYGAGGRLVPQWVVLEAIGRGELATVKSLAVNLCHARKALGGRKTIEVHLNEGLRMTEAGLVAVASALADQGPPIRRYAQEGRFTAAEIRRIRWYDLTDAEIAEIHGVSKVMIHKIRTRGAYAWVDEDPAWPASDRPRGRREGRPSS